MLQALWIIRVSEPWGMSSGIRSNPIPEITTARLLVTKGLVCHASLSSSGEPRLRVRVLTWELDVEATSGRTAVGRAG